MTIPKASPRLALIAYGSETGNAQETAEEIARLTERLHYVTQVLELDAVQPAALLKFDLVVISISTTGQGDLPNNSRVFWRGLLRRKLSASFLSGVQVACFGLGDSSYPKFNFAVRKLSKRFLQLGASFIHAPGEADEQHEDGIEGTFLPWLSGLLDALLTKQPLPEGLSLVPEDASLPPKWILHENHETCRDEQIPATDLALVHVPASLIATIIQNTRLTPESHFQDVRHIVFAVPKASYVAGDVLTIFPHNPESAVADLLRLQNWLSIADCPLTLMPNDQHVYTPSPLPNLPSGPVTLRTLLTAHLSILSVPRRTFFRAIAPFTDDPSHRARLLEFADPTLRDELYDYTTRPRRNILEVLGDFPSVKIPWSRVTSILPPLRGRQFSIASGGPLNTFRSSTSNPDQKDVSLGGLRVPASLLPLDPSQTRIDLLVAIVSYKTILRVPRTGVCTSYLSALQPGTTLPITLSHPTTPLAPALSTPLILVGPGTGLAPLRALLWERALAADASHPSSAVGNCLLIFGARNAAADYFFSEEWAYLASRIPLRVVTAFSRDGPRKVYVQDRIAERDVGEEITRGLVDDQGTMVVCGSAGRMPRAVRAAVVEAVARKDGGEDGVESGIAEGKIAEVEKQGRWKVETW